MELLTVKDAAELKGCSIQYIKKLAKDGKIETIQQINPQNNKMQYLIPPSALPADLQKKYYSKFKADAGTAPEMKPVKISKKQHLNTVKKAFDEYSEAERQEITLWCSILTEWQNIRAQYKNKTEVDPKFVGKCQLEHPDLQISVDTLYRKYAAFKENAYDGLIDKRGGWNKGQVSITAEAWRGFLFYYFDQNKPTVSSCYLDMKDWIQEFYPEQYDNIPSERSFRRNIQTIEKAVLEMMRNGDKSFSDRCLPHMIRLYDELNANDVWIADNHTLDIQSVNGDGKIHRLHLTAFLDAKSGVLVGWNITDNPCSQSTIIALRHGIKRFGIPKMVYFDNGSEFLTHDVGGRGHRTRKNIVENPPTILQHLGIEMRNALVRNAKAKPIERTFYTVKNQFSKPFSGFCGGTVLERPESLKRVIKNGQLPRDYEIRDNLDTWIDGDFNLQNYGGSEVCYKNKSRLDVWNESIANAGMRTATDDELSLMLARSTRYQKISRNGVFVNMFGEKLYYTDFDVAWKHIGKEVYVRYDPAELLSVRVYDKETDKYMFTWGLADKLLLDFIEQDKEKISDGMSIQRGVKKLVKARAEGLTAELTPQQRITILDASIRRAHAAKGERFKIVHPTNIIPVRAQEEPMELPMAVGENVMKIDIDQDRINRNIQKSKEEF